MTPESANRSMPSSIVIPELAYPDVPTAVDWLCRTFGFAERLRIGTHRAQLTFDGGAIIVTALPHNLGVKQHGSESQHLVSHSVMVRVTDVDAHYEHVKQSGIQLVNTPTDYPYGERQYVVDDIGGHRWTFSQTIADIDPKSWGGLLPK